MDNKPLLPVERRVLHDAVGGKTERLSQREFEALLNGGCYRCSLGNPPRAQHYRRSLEDGTCLHLIVDGETGWLHCDRFDPHRDPLSLAFHLLTEAHRETVSTAFTVWAIVRMISR